MESTSAPVALVPDERRRAGGVSRLELHLFLSLLFCAAVSQLVLFDYDTTVGLWIAWTIMWGLYWGVFAVLQAYWWQKGYAKFWRPVYPWALFVCLVLSLFFLLLLLWPRFRRWLFRVMRPTDPPAWEASLGALVRLRDDGVLSAEEFEVKRTELLGRPPGAQGAA